MAPMFSYRQPQGTNVCLVVSYAACLWTLTGAEPASYFIALSDSNDVGQTGQNLEASCEEAIRIQWSHHQASSGFDLVRKVHEHHPSAIFETARRDCYVHLFDKFTDGMRELKTNQSAIAMMVAMNNNLQRQPAHTVAHIKVGDTILVFDPQEGWVDQDHLTSTHNHGHCLVFFAKDVHEP